MALALGLDPDRLASGEPGARPRAGGDVRRAVAALKFALQHPLVEVGEGLRPAPHHLSSTAVSRSRQQRKPSQVGGATGRRRLLPLKTAVAAMTSASASAVILASITPSVSARRTVWQLAGFT